MRKPSTLVSSPEENKVGGGDQGMGTGDGASRARAGGGGGKGAGLEGSPGC